MRTVLAAFAVLMLAACGQTDPAVYPPQVEMNFRNACQAQSPPSGLCNCVWQRIQAEIPASDFVALERLPINERATHPLSEQIAGYAVACREEIADAAAPPVEQPPAP